MKACLLHRWPDGTTPHHADSSCWVSKFSQGGQTYRRVYLRDMREKVMTTKKRWGHCSVVHSASDERSSRANHRSAWQRHRSRSRRGGEPEGCSACPSRGGANKRKRQTSPILVTERRKQGNMQGCATHSKVRCVDCTHNHINTDKCCAMQIFWRNTMRHLV